MSKKSAFRLTGRHSVFDRFASRITRLVGSPWAFALALGIIIVWALAGPWLHYSETWQLVINTGTTIITFLMVFLIQQSQNKDSMALHIKLNELIASNKLASNRTISVEDLDATDLEMLRAFYSQACRTGEEGRRAQVQPFAGRRQRRACMEVSGRHRQRDVDARGEAGARPADVRPDAQHGAVKRLRRWTGSRARSHVGRTPRRR